ncbi:MAG: recombination regulator RecX [Oceanospirillaceae bacterium]|nr:recombination regulator RecX [Oceanospirillaceae bacterium]MBT13575.1 recombination regulator RecX [Oceanospirillaceae bacterium]|tara:strand:- start:38638 stop:39126 length:489 start_codon:yes stop_codon:yes gene_type:complete
MKKPKPDPLTFSELRCAAVDLLSRRDHSRLELQRKLRPKAASAEDLETLLDELAERRWQSDERFAEAYVNSRSQRGQGPLRMKHELRNKGVADTEISAAMEESDSDWYQSAINVAEKKFGQTPDLSDLKLKARVYSFLAYRGFTGDQISYVLDRLGSFSADD